jgi:hypothetical protein
MLLFDEDSLGCFSSSFSEVVLPILSLVYLGFGLRC